MIARLVASMWLALQVLPAVCAIVMARAPGFLTLCPSVAPGVTESCGAPEPQRCEEAMPACAAVPMPAQAPDDCSELSCEDASHCCPLCEPICCDQPVAPSPRDPAREDTRRGLEAFSIYFSPASHPALTAMRVGRLIPSGVLSHYAVPGDEFRATTGVWLI